MKKPQTMPFSKSQSRDSLWDPDQLIAMTSLRSGLRVRWKQEREADLPQGGHARRPPALRSARMGTGRPRFLPPSLLTRQPSPLSCHGRPQPHRGV